MNDDYMIFQMVNGDNNSNSTGGKGGCLDPILVIIAISVG